MFLFYSQGLFYRWNKKLTGGKCHKKYAVDTGYSLILNIGGFLFSIFKQAAKALSNTSCGRRRNKMWSLSFPLLSVTVLLCATRLVGGYSFHNCIEFSKGKTFKCIHRNQYILGDIIKDLPHSTLDLTIAVNPVSHIPDRSFIHLRNLQQLRLDHNHLGVIDQFAFQGLHQLKSLNLSFNYIPELSTSVFDDLHNLTFLSLTNNSLKRLPHGIFSHLFNLNTLIIKQNYLTNFSEIAMAVSSLKNLTLLDLCFNRLTSLSHSNVSLPESLNRLYLCRNNLSTLGCEPSFLGSIEILDLSYNSELPTKALEGVNLRRINYLRLRSTKVNIVEFIQNSDIHAGHVDFTSTHLNTEAKLVELCKLLKRKLSRITKLTLVGNKIETLTANTLAHCPNITKTLDLSKVGQKKSDCLQFLKEQRQITTFIAEHNHYSSLPTCEDEDPFRQLEELRYRYNRILSVNSHAFHHTPNLKTLWLNINTIAFLHQKALSGLRQLSTLRLDNNLLSDLFADTFEDLFNLNILNLRNNRISVIFNNTFRNLKNLTTLDLGGNKITHFEPSGLCGLERLSKLYLDGNNLQTIDSSAYHIFQNTLTTLDLRQNMIHFEEDVNFSPFVNLTKLEDLKLDEQKPYGLHILPRTLFRGLYSLRSLYVKNNMISYLAADVFRDLKHLNFLSLDNCCVGPTHLPAGIFKDLTNLTILTVENMGIQNLSTEVFGNISQLKKIQLNHNVMQTFPVTVLQSLTKLQYLDIRNVPLSCTCENSLLRNWTVNNQKVQMIYLYSLPCPHDPKVKFFNFDTSVCNIDLGQYLFFCTAPWIFLFTVWPLLYVKLYWKIKYSYYVFRSWFSEQWRRLREKEENCKYDAFISYNSSDELWVMNELLPNLEGNGSSFKICLHHRDFEPGRYIIDNIVSAVYSSRKTICVVSRNFLSSEWCSLEIQLASYRLFDEHRDVLLLVLLEPISERQLSSYHRMRKVMLKKTYLQWPGSECTNPPQAQGLFWSQLRRAIGTTSRIETEEKGTRVANKEDADASDNHV
uniref:Toll-like receptor 21 n=1 Tax=Takifugu rubripes TaxID=31033 RepID=A0A6D2VX27_TAKRU